MNASPKQLTGAGSKSAVRETIKRGMWAGSPRYDGGDSAAHDSTATRFPEGEIREAMEDMLAYVRYTFNDGEVTTKRKLERIVATLSHDLNGILQEKPFFVPQSKGYADRLMIFTGFRSFEG